MGVLGPVGTEALAIYEAIIIPSQISKSACPSLLYWSQSSEDIWRAVPRKCIPKLGFFFFSFYQTVPEKIIDGWTNISMGPVHIDAITVSVEKLVQISICCISHCSMSVSDCICLPHSTSSSSEKWKKSFQPNITRNQHTFQHMVSTQGMLVGWINNSEPDSDRLWQAQHLRRTQGLCWMFSWPQTSHVYQLPLPPPPAWAPVPIMQLPFC